ncbi:MAG: hypothetical protein H0V32_07110 [Nocardioidaceae bacterium]|nr:hypothetical protein [Nocardioidaceae bacterium]MDQ3325040.1 hypothetical protein [Actinomycetota bacterium]
MSDSGQLRDTGGPDEAPDERRRQRLAALGETLATSSSDERATGWSELPADGSGDDELMRDVPPHHG